MAGRDTRYPRVTVEEVVQRAPAIALLPDEPHPFGEEDARFFRGLGLRARLCGGRDLMWYGAWSVEGLSRLRILVDSLRV